MALIKRSFLERRPVEIGKIKIGTRGAKKSTSGGNSMFLPQKLDHFLVTTMEREGKDGPFKRDEHVHAIVGDEPRELYGHLMYETVEENLHTEMCVYAGRRRQWTCDGEERTLRDGKEEPCQREANPPCKCKPYARLHLQLEAQPQMAGYYVFRSHGWASTNNLQTALEEIYREFGTLYRAPVRLFMQKTEDVYMDGSNERTGSSWKVGLTLRLSPVEAREYLASQARMAIQTRDMLRLESGAVIGDLHDYDREHEIEIADEFHPPEGLEASVRTQEALDGAVALIAEKSVEAESEAPPAPESEDAEEELGLTPAKELANLFEAAKERGVKFTKAQVERCLEGIQDPDLVEQTLDWVKNRVLGEERGDESDG